MLLYYFPIAQNIVYKTVGVFFRDVNAFMCMRTDFTIFLFTGLIPVYTKKVSEYDQKILQSQTADNTMAPHSPVKDPSHIVY